MGRPITSSAKCGRCSRRSASTPAHPFPQVVNKSLNFIVELSGRDAFGRDTTIAIVKAPRVLPRVIKLPPEIARRRARRSCCCRRSSTRTSPSCSPGARSSRYSQFRVTRDADLWIDEEEVKNLRQALQGELPQRQFGLPLRLEVAASCPTHLARFLLHAVRARATTTCIAATGRSTSRGSPSLIDQVDIDALKYPPFVPGLPERLRGEPDILAAIRRHDILLHHPFQSFDPVVEFIRRAADDPDVVAIKQTVYRTGVNSVLMEALIEAAERGKEVTVVVELMARFDEEANINWAERLEQAGAQVVYGVFGFKTHAKLALVLRRETRAAGRHAARVRTRTSAPATTTRAPRAALHRLRPAHRRRRDLRRRQRSVPATSPACRSPSRMKRLWLAPFTMQRRIDRDDPPRGAQREGRQAGAHHRQDECADRRGA